MDRVVERKRIDRRILIGAGVAGAILLILLFWLFAPRADSQSVNPDRLTIADVQQGVFDDFLPLRARVTPLVTVYLDAVEGGRVEKKLVEDGARPVLYHGVANTCWTPALKGLVLQHNSIYNGWRFEDAWLDR